MTDDPPEEHPNGARHHRGGVRQTADAKKSPAASQGTHAEVPEMADETPDSEQNRGDFPDQPAEHVEPQPAQIARRSPRRRRHPPAPSPAKRKRS